MSFDLIEFQLSAPGKIILFGEHSVVHKRTAIATTINKRTALKFTETKNQLIDIKMPQIGVIHSFCIKEIKKMLQKSIPSVNGGLLSLSEPKRILHDKFLDEICNDLSSLGFISLNVQQTSALKAIFYLLRGILGTIELDFKGFSLELSSQLSIGAGMGSSASFAVCLAAAFFYYVRRLFKLRFNGLKNICKSHVDPYIMDLDVSLGEFSNQEKDIINNWAYAVERIMHGSPSGLDNTVCTFGSLIEMYHNLGDSKGKTFNILPNSPELRILLVDTGVSRVTSNLVGKVAVLKNNHSQIVDHILDAMGEIAKKASNMLQQLSSVESLQEQKETFQILEELVDINQGLLKTLGVSHPLLDTICELSLKYKLHSKLTGAGGGGYAFTLVPPEFDEFQIKGFCKQLEKIGLQAMDVTLGCPGIKLES